MNDKLTKTLILGLGYRLELEMYNKTWDLIAFSKSYIGISRGKLFDSIHHDFGIYPKPYLRDLSDLTKDIEHNGERFVPIEEITKNGNWCDAYQDWLDMFIDFSEENEHYNYIPENALKAPYEIFELLVEWHFNVFDLEHDQFIRVTNENNPYK